jgi:hypothetical protein
LLSALFSSHIRVVFLCALFAAGVGWSAERARAQSPLAPPIGLEVVGELRPGTPNIPLLLVVQWDPVDGAESYELERAEPAATPAARVFAPVASIVPPSDQLPGAKVRYVDESGFAAAGGDCFRVRAVSGTEVGDWAEVCLPVPPSSGGPPPSSGDPPAAPDFAFDAQFSADYELTILRWTVPPGFEQVPVEVWRNGTFVPLAVFLPSDGPRAFQLVLKATSGCFRLEIAGAPPVEPICRIFPTDLGSPEFPTKLRVLDGPVTVQATGRAEAPVAVLWRASGGPTDLLFEISRMGPPGVARIAPVVLLSYAGTEWGPGRDDLQLFLDAEFDPRNPCYLVTAVSSAGESLIGEACLGDAPGPPDAGSGLADRSGESGTRWMFMGTVMLVVAGSLRRPAR